MHYINWTFWRGCQFQTLSNLDTVKTSRHINIGFFSQYFSAFSPNNLQTTAGFSWKICIHIIPIKDYYILIISSFKRQ
jgi:hypothetical protein